MTDLPVWLQEIRDRVDKATKGPWIDNGNEIVAADNPRRVIAGALIDEDNAFIAHARTDVPRLIGLVEEMGAAIGDAAEVLQECVEGETVLLERLWRIWAKYRGEAESE